MEYFFKSGNTYIVHTICEIETKGDSRGSYFFQFSNIDFFSELLSVYVFNYGTNTKAQNGQQFQKKNVGIEWFEKNTFLL